MTPKSEGFYCPKSIDRITAYFSLSFPNDGTLEHRHGYFRNIGYTIQYLEYLNYILEESELHGTVKTMSQKSFIIAGMGIVEAILWYVLKKNSAHKTETWKEVHNLKCNEFEDGGIRRRVRVILEDKLPVPEETEMTLDAMRKRVEDRKLLGVDTQVYRDLNHLRGLRNRVHIHAVQHDKDTDWWSFDSKDVELMKSALYSILTCNLFSASSGYSDVPEFLKKK